MDTQTQREIMNYINQISIATTDKDNNEYQIELLTQHLTEIASDMNVIYQSRKKEKSESASDSPTKSSTSPDMSNNIISTSNSSNENDALQMNDTDSDELRRAKRKELSQSATKTVNKHNMTITLNM